ncbi:MAG TPA: hypothetical protein VF541_21405 [Longimicrobium sp.]|jgi:hypothetical protein
MKRLVLVLGMLAAAALPARAQRWTSVAGAPAVIEGLGRFTAFTRNLSMLYTGFEANLQNPSDSLSVVRVQSFQASIDSVPGNGWIRLSQQLRGSVHKDADARVVMVVNAGGQVVTRVFPYGRAFDGEVSVPLPVLRTRWAPDRHYFATLALIVERRTSRASVLTSIDSFDATVDRSSAPASRRSR